MKSIYYSLLHISVALILTSSCVDRLDFDLSSQPEFPLVIDGFISDLDPPYTVLVRTSFDTKSDYSLRKEASVKKMTLLDDRGNTEDFFEIRKGEYRTREGGIKGVVGRAYRLRIELLTGQVYESVADTIPQPGRLDSIYYKFVESPIETATGSNYAFDVYFDGSQGASAVNRFMWRFESTFKVDTTPELDKAGEPCSNNLDCVKCSICNLIPKCTGLRNVGTPKDPVFIRLEPCSCCTCWYNIFNEKPILSDAKFVRFGKFQGVKAGTVPVHKWIFQHKVYVYVTQLSLSRQAFNFFQSIEDQKEAINSIFQPVTGRIKSNFRQVSGVEGKLEGIFYGAAMSQKSFQLNRKDVPPQTYQFPIEDPPVLPPRICWYLYPNSTNIKPAFWQD